MLKKLRPVSNPFCFFSARDERARIKSKMESPFSAEQRRAQAQNGIKGVARRGPRFMPDLSLNSVERCGTAGGKHVMIESATNVLT
jgi:hypothetical protein